MRNIKVVPFLLICILPLALSARQTTAKKILDKQDFLIDPSKPYVYLHVENIVLRKPIHQGELGSGIWLQLKNNCRLPIVVIASGPLDNSSDKVLWVGDEVVPNVPPIGEAAGTAIGYMPGQEHLTDIFNFPNQHEAEIENAENAAKGTTKNTAKQNGIAQRPQGNINRLGQILKVIPPGGELLFNLPISHVSPTWHIEIPFRFAIKQQNKLRQPYSYVALYWEDVPSADRSSIQ